jgi:glycosyltransferase involved in cell wall biosynthesis
MKIVFLNDWIHAYATGAPSAVGGAERQQWLLARALAGAGWKVTVGVRHGLSRDERVRVEGVDFVGIGSSGLLRSWHRFLKLERPQWWYWRCASHLLGAAAGIAKLTGARMIFAAGFDTDVIIRRALYARARWWPLYALGLSWADRIFVQNGQQYDGLPERWRRKAIKIPSMTLLFPTVIPHANRDPYVAWVAMLRQFKRPDLLVEIARRAPDVRFVVCGGTTTFTAAPGYGEEIVRILRSLPNVEYRGQVSPDEALNLIVNASLFLSTSDGEGFPNTFLQAWSGGTPVISLKIDPDGIIERHGLGKVSGNVEQTISDIRGLMQSVEERDTIASRAKEYVVRSHSPAAVIRQFHAAVGAPVPDLSLRCAAI